MKVIQIICLFYYLDIIRYTGDSVELQQVITVQNHLLIIEKNIPGQMEKTKSHATI